MRYMFYQPHLFYVYPCFVHGNRKRMIVTMNILNTYHLSLFMRRTQKMIKHCKITGSRLDFLSLHFPILLQNFFLVFTSFVFHSETVNYCDIGELSNCYHLTKIQQKLLKSVTYLKKKKWFGVEQKDIDFITWFCTFACNDFSGHVCCEVYAKLQYDDLMILR